MTQSAYSPRPWWASAVFYQVYPRSFADGNGDGTGDLIGLRERLGHLRDLGVDAIWLSPFYRSPMADGGYDVADPCDVDPCFGTLADFDAMLAEAHRLGIKVTVDVVPNHVSDQHEWFQAALAAAPGSPERARFIFRDGRGEHGELPPNNWPSVFGGPAWHRTSDGQWYLHLFAPEQPDLNWTNPEVRAEFERVFRFWLDRGVDGFRIDVAHGMAKPEGLPDVDLSVIPSREEGATMPSLMDVRWDRDEVHEYHRMFRRVLDSYPGERMAVGEAWVPDSDRLARYVRPDELNLTFNFELVEAPWGADSFSKAIQRSLEAMSGVGAPCTWVLDNHDVDRAATRYGGGEVGIARARAALLVQLSLPGAAYLYNGDELALENVDLPDEALQDPTWERSGHTDRGRDGERVPLPWSGTEPPYGFTTGTSSWLPMPEGWGDKTVAAQDADADSMLNLCRQALRLRRELSQLTGPDFEWSPAPVGALAYHRGSIAVALNAGAEPLPLPDGDVLLASGPLPEPGPDGRVLPGNTAVWLQLP
ncbi:MAG TPA: glycoside hydrolase family 13 protein [Jatrophihabitantaceae bacterium]|nr:glycoside hydrolase family 13 protein [Jatrophihabitantaceae bacterium]